MYGTNFEIEDKVLDENFVVPIGKAKIQRPGTDITLVAHSIGVGFCMSAAEILAKEGISAEVVNMRSIRPLDVDTVNKSVMKTHHMITVEGNLKFELHNRLKIHNLCVQVAGQCSELEQKFALKSLKAQHSISWTLPSFALLEQMYQCHMPRVWKILQHLRQMMW